MADKIWYRPYNVKLLGKPSSVQLKKNERNKRLGQIGNRRPDEIYLCRTLWDFDFTLSEKKSHCRIFGKKINTIWFQRDYPGFYVDYRQYRSKHKV